MDPNPDDDRLLSTDLHVEATSRLMEALVESENRMRRRLELLADALIETDASWSLVFLNHAWETLTGLPAQECLGQPAEQFFPPECRADVARVLADRTGEHQELATWITHQDGRVVHVILTTSPITTGGVVAVLRDVTREHGYQEELTKLSVVASSTSNLVVITDARGRIDWVNPAFEDRTGYSLDEVRGRSPGSFLQGPGTDPHVVERLRTAIAEERPITEELINYTRTGEPYWITINLTPVFDAAGRLERFISVQADITERKRIERMKTEFVSTVSHELRTPLTSIRGALGLLAAGVTGPLPDRALEMLQIAEKNGERLTLLINDLLDMERLVEDGLPLDIQTQALMPIVEQALDDNRTFASEYGVQVELAERCDDALVAVDSLRLTQALANLLSNACKFAPRGSTVTVGAAGTADRVRLSVADEGPGVPESFRDAIFEKFSQADSSDTRARGGTGLGLAITKELVERMGGTVGYESQHGAGATFFLDLPLATPAASA